MSVNETTANNTRKTSIAMLQNVLIMTTNLLNRFHTTWTRKKPEEYREIISTGWKKDREREGEGVGTKARRGAKTTTTVTRRKVLSFSRKQTKWICVDLEYSSLVLSNESTWEQHCEWKLRLSILCGLYRCNLFHCLHNRINVPHFRYQTNFVVRIRRKNQFIHCSV